MVATAYNLLIEQGSTFTRTLQFKAGSTILQLDSWNARAQIRAEYQSSTILATFNTTISTVADTATISLSASTTAALTPNFYRNKSNYRIGAFFSTAMMSSLPKGFYVWDLELFDGDGFVYRQLEGAVLVSPEVTR